METNRVVGLRDPHYLENGLTDGGEVVKLVRAAFYLQEVSLYSFLLEVDQTPGPQCSWKD
jgi:hypothetical protein